MLSQKFSIYLSIYVMNTWGIVARFVAIYAANKKSGIEEEDRKANRGSGECAPLTRLVLLAQDARYVD